MLNFNIGVSSSVPLSQRLLAEARGYALMQEEEKAKKLYVEAVEKTKAELDKKPSIQREKAFEELRTEHFNFLEKVRQKSLAQEKGKFVNYLFEKALSRLSSLEVSNKPSLFLVYAHENKAHGKAEAGTSKYLIEKLSQIQVVLYSDQTPIGQPYSSPLGEQKKDSKLEDILTNQLCLLPGQLRSDVKPVDKVVVCCSEVLGSYLKWPEYDSFYQKLRDAYGKDREAYLKGGEPGNAWAIREVVGEFSEGKKHKAEFHHVLTEMVFLRIRAEHLKDGHGIIPVPLTRNSYDDCLSRFISTTRVRMGDIPRFEEKAQAGQGVYPNQSRHWVLFKLIERLLASSDEAKTFLDKFWQGYSDCISWLKEASKLDGFEFIKRVDGIFDEIERALHKQLASTVQQVYPAWQQVDTRLLNQSRDLAQIQTEMDSLVARLLGNLQENIQKLRTTYLEGLQQDREIKDALANYVSLEGTLLHDSTRFDLESKVQDFLSSDKKVLLLLGGAGSGKSTFNRKLAVNLWQEYIQTNAVRGSTIPVFIQLSSLPESNRNLVEAFFESQDFLKEKIKELKNEYRFVLILDGFDEIEGRQRDFYRDNQLSDWRNAKIIISSRPEYLGYNYQYKFHLPGERSALQEFRLAPFSEKTIERYLDQYKQTHPKGLWSAEQYKEALKQPDLKELVGNPFLLKITLSVLPELSQRLQASGQHFTRIGLYDEFVNSWFERSQQRLAQIQLNPEEAKEFRRLEQMGFADRGVGFSKKLALEMYQAGEVVSTYLAVADDPWEEPLAELNQAWRKRLLGHENAMTVLMRLNAPLICQDQQSSSGKAYRFIHKSLRDYFVTIILWEEFPNVNQSAWINKLILFRDPDTLDFLVERVQQEKSLIKNLINWINASKNNKNFQIAAANALTILARAKVPLSSENFNEINASYADLSGGIFNNTHFKEAILSCANLSGGIFNHTNFKEANLSCANLSGGIFNHTNFKEANLSRTNLNSGIFSQVQFEGANLTESNFQNVWLHNTNFRNAKIDEIELGIYPAFEGDEIYVQLSARIVGDYNRLNLLSIVEEFLCSDKKVLLLLGDAGSFTRYLAKSLLRSYICSNKSEQDAIPLLISLASIDNPVHDLIPAALKKRGLSKEQIQRLKKEKQRFVFILDGYDEIQQSKNLYQSNGINQPGNWQGQVVISCRSEYLGQGQSYQRWFQPNQYQRGEAWSFQEVVIEPFSEEEQNQYVEKYVERNVPIWDAQQFKKALEQPYLKELGSNPFLLGVVLEVLPYLENDGKSRTAIQLRMDLYTQFVRQWFNRNEQRLITRDLTENERDIVKEMCNEDFAEHGIEFVKDLAVHLYTKNEGNPVVEYSPLKDKGNWKKDFFEPDDKKQLLRETWPLTRSGNQYCFIHKSLLEYFVVQSLFESFDVCMNLSTRQRLGSDTSIDSFESQPALPPQAMQEASLVPKHWVRDQGVVRWLTERVQQDLLFKKELLAIIERSKTDPGVHQAAANAMTILVKAGVQFN